MKTATYWATAEGAGRYTLRLSLSDPGEIPAQTEITLLGQTREQCEFEVNGAREQGYQIISGLRRAMQSIGAD